MRRAITWTIGATILVGALLIVGWGASFYRHNTFDSEGWRLIDVDDDTLTVEIMTSACAWVHSPSVVESPTSVEVRVRWTRQPVPCAAVAVADQVRVVLDEPLGERQLSGCEGPAYDLEPPCRGP